MKIRYFSFALTLASSLTLVGSARADVAPPPDYVETCSVANKLTATSECLLCATDRMRVDRCYPLLVPYCYKNVCQVWGGRFEVWCRTKGAGTPVVPPETLSLLTPSTYPLPTGPDGGATAPSSCLPYTPPATPDAGGPGGQGGASALGGAGGTGGTGGQGVIGGSSAAGGTGGQSAVTSAPPVSDTGGQIAIGGSPATGGTGGQSVVTSAPPVSDTGGQIAIGGSPATGGTGGQSSVSWISLDGGSLPAGGTGGQGGTLVAGDAGLAATGGTGSTSASNAGKPDDSSSGCSVGGWLSVKALGPWLLAGLFGAIVTLARRRRR